MWKTWPSTSCLCRPCANRPEQSARLPSMLSPSIQPLRPGTTLSWSRSEHNSGKSSSTGIVHTSSLCYVGFILRGIGGPPAIGAAAI